MSSLPRITVNISGEEESGQEEHFQNTHYVDKPEQETLRLENGPARHSFTSSRRKTAPDEQEMHTSQEISHGGLTSCRRSMFVKDNSRNSLEGLSRNIGDVSQRRKNSTTEISTRRKFSVQENMETVRRRILSLKPEIDASSAFIGALTRRGSARPRTPRKVSLKHLY